MGVIDLIHKKAIYFEGDNGEIMREDAVPSNMLSEMEDFRQELIGNLDYRFFLIDLITK